jgi:hypothetical protein
MLWRIIRQCHRDRLAAVLAMRGKNHGFTFRLVCRRLFRPHGWKWIDGGC